MHYETAAGRRFDFECQLPYNSVKMHCLHKDSRHSGRATQKSPSPANANSPSNGQRIMNDFALEKVISNRKTLERVLDNLKEGIIAHDTDRRIYYFNREAERITGYRREEVLGRDCHEVFGSPFCGKNCQFCHDRPIKTGQKRICHQYHDPIRRVPSHRNDDHHDAEPGRTVRGGPFLFSGCNGSAAAPDRGRKTHPV